MSDFTTAAVSDLATVAYREETNWGEDPSGGSQLQDLRYTGESLQANMSYGNSTEIDPQRNVAGVYLQSRDATGDISGEFHYGTWDDFIEAGLYSADWTSEVTTGAQTDISGVNATNHFNRASGSFVTDGFTVGSWVRIEGFDGQTTAPDGVGTDNVAKITAVTASNLSIEGWVVQDETAGDSVTITQLSEVVNANEERSFYIEKEFTDVSSTFEGFTGCAVNTLAWATTVEQIVTLTTGFMAEDEVSPAPTATNGTGTNASVNTNEAYNAVDHAELMLTDGASYSVREFSINVTNNLRGQKEVGNLGNTGVAKGKFQVSGTVTALFRSQAQANKALAGTTASLALVLKDTAGNRMILDIPSVKFTTAPRLVSGENQDVLVTLDFTAFKDATEAITFRVARDAA